MNVDDYKDGQRVRLHIDGTVWAPDGRPRFHYGDRSSGKLLSELLAMPGVKIEHLAPAEWPPQAGDKWRDGRNNTWFGARYNSSYGDAIVLLDIHGSQSSLDTDELLDRYKPWTLIHRDDS